MSKKSGFVWVTIVLLLSISSLVLLGTQMRFPVGETATIPYILAVLILAIILLIENVISMLAPSRLLSNLQDLRNDIIFLRVDIDEALQRYEPLVEGETLPYALKTELSEILNDLDVIDYAHSNMTTLTGKMIEELPYTEDPPNIKERKKQQLGLYKDSYSLHDAKCTEIVKLLGAKLKKLNKRLSMLSAASDDRAGENNIRSLLTQRLQSLERNHAQLNQDILSINHYINNPNEIPQELRASVNTQNSDGS